jgi:hypothetical protein
MLTIEQMVDKYAGWLIQIGDKKLRIVEESYKCVETPEGDFVHMFSFVEYGDEEPQNWAVKSKNKNPTCTWEIRVL